MLQLMFLLALHGGISPGFVTYTYFWHALPIIQERTGMIGSSLLSFLGVFLLFNASLDLNQRSRI